jgi:hypothetical protein
VPPPRLHGLEQAFVRFGVALKQRGAARLAFDESGRQAGFFDNGMDRLVEPIIAGGGGSGDRGRLPTETPDGEPPHRGGRSTKKVHPEESGFHPFIQGLLDTLPAPETTWSIEGRGKWLQTAANIFDLIYMGDGTITVLVKKAADQTD